jgi:hypothetical protein
MLEADFERKHKRTAIPESGGNQDLTDFRNEMNLVPSAATARYSGRRGRRKARGERRRAEAAGTLAVGIPTRGKITLKVHVVERRPCENPIKGSVLRIILFAAHAYAGMIGSTEVWLCNPVNETMVEKYQQLGYSAVRDRTGSATHMRKDV